MRKVYLVVSILIAVILTGCLSQSQATPTVTATSLPPNPTAIATKVPTIPTVAATNTQLAPTVVSNFPTQSDLASGCTVVTQKPTPGPTPTSVFSPVSDTEWVKGPADARITLIEYGDFQ